VSILAGCTCDPVADDRELEQMCVHLTKLRIKENHKPVATQECIANAKKEGVSHRRALCRIFAINLSEYWNRCRTGTARHSSNRK